MGTVKVTNIEPIADNGTITFGSSGDTLALAAGAVMSGFGKIGQVQSTTKTDAFGSNAMAGGAHVDVTGLSVNITPSSTSSKILVFAYINTSSDAGSDTAITTGMRLVRGSTPIFVGTDGTGNQSNTGSYTSIINSDNRQSLVNFSGGLDSPASTSQQTYKVQITQGGNSGSGIRTVYVNRTVRTDNAYPSFKMASTITAMEILD